MGMTNLSRIRMLIVACAVTLFAGNVFAANELKVDGDLMIHPDQVAKFFDIITSKIGASAGWDWPQLSFTAPYKTSWSQVSARGPFAVHFDTADLKSQEVGFELDWTQPTVNIGRFEIHDTIARNVGGINLIINLDGACNNMVIRVPDGHWKVKGKVKWTWTNQGMQASWKDFAFEMNPSAATSVDLGQCNGPAGLNQELVRAIETVSHDQAWMQDVLRDGVLNWVSSTLGDLQGELLKARNVNLKEGLTMAWQPTGLSDGGQGVLRVAGQIVLTKQTAATTSQTVARSYDVPSLAGVKESGFVMPRGTLPQVVAFMQKNNELDYRAKSSDIDSFNDLMQNGFMQFFVWPDLMSFNPKSLFYFDVSSEKPPVFTNGVMLGTGGIRYDVQAPLLVNQWAPGTVSYLPYVDFRSPMKGSLSAKIDDGNFVLQLVPSALDVTATFRPEFQKVRSVNSWLATSLLGSRVSDYLASKSFSFALPTWQLGEGLNVSLRDVQLWKYSFRIPLDFKADAKPKNSK